MFIRNNNNPSVATFRVQYNNTFQELAALGLFLLIIQKKICLYIHLRAPDFHNFLFITFTIYSCFTYILHLLHFSLKVITLIHYIAAIPYGFVTFRHSQSGHSCERTISMKWFFQAMDTVISQ